MAVEAFRRLGLPLVVAGGGPAFNELRRSAPPNVTFLGQQDDASVVDLMQRARALVFPSQDDFGLVPVEAMACGTPIIAYRGGGATHTVVDGVTGAFFDEQTPESIEAAVRAFDPDALDHDAIRIHAEHWDVGAFRARVRARVEEVAGLGPRSPETASLVDRRLLGGLAACSPDTQVEPPEGYRAPVLEIKGQIVDPGAAKPGDEPEATSSSVA